MTTKMFLHICCGPCACGTLPVWRARGVEVLGFYFNPNVHPFMEFKRRLEGVREVSSVTGTGLVVDASYDPQAWFLAVSGEPGGRCRDCIEMRLERTACEAADRGCDIFSTTLSISPWQDHDAIKTCGLAAAERHGVEFAYEDLRGEYSGSRELSRRLGLYRQKYCGCLVSEWDRYRGRRASGEDVRSEDGL